MNCKSIEAKNLLLGRCIHDCDSCKHYHFHMGLDYGSSSCELPNRKRISKKRQYKPLRGLISYDVILNHDGKCKWFRPRQK